MSFTIMVVAGLLTGTSFLNNAAGPADDGSGATGSAAPVAGSPARPDPASERRPSKCRDAEPLSWNIKLAPDDEPGERLVLAGRVLGVDREPMRGVKVYVFHPDAAGFYSENRGMDNTNPRLCGILRTDDLGRYRISTVKPSRSAAGVAIPRVHYEVIAEGRPAETFLLTFDAPRVDGAARRAETWAGTRPLERDARGVWRCTRDLWIH